MPEKNGQNSQHVSVDKLMQDAGIQTVTAAPVSPEKPTAPPQDGAFLAGDGRTLYRYTLDGQVVITPKPIENMTFEEFSALSITAADNGSSRIPQDLTVKFKDPQWAGHWFNRKAGDGRQISRARSLGYVPASRDDCEWIAHGLNDADGGITDNDLVLFKIHKAKMFMQYKEWQDEARRKGGRDQYKSEAEGYIGGANEKVGIYHTPHALNEFSGLAHPQEGFKGVTA